MWMCNERQDLQSQMTCWKVLLSHVAGFASINAWLACSWTAVMSPLSDALQSSGLCEVRHPSADGDLLQKLADERLDSCVLANHQDTRCLHLYFGLPLEGLAALSLLLLQWQLVCKKQWIMLKLPYGGLVKKPMKLLIQAFVGHSESKAS